MRDETQALLGTWFAGSKRAGNNSFNGIGSGISPVSSTIQFSKAGRYRIMLNVVNVSSVTNNTPYTVTATFTGQSGKVTLGSGTVPKGYSAYPHQADVDVETDGARMSVDCNNNMIEDFCFGIYKLE